MNQSNDDLYIKNRNTKIKIKHIIKIIFLLCLIYIDIILKPLERNNLFQRYEEIPRLKYYFLDIEKYKEIINLQNEGILEIYPNYNQTKNNTVFLIIPGGSYHKVSPLEGLPIVKKFYSYGYSASILNYSTAPKYHYPTNYNQGVEALKILSTKFKKIFMVGFSAGGHLTALLGTPLILKEKYYLYNTIGMVLCYPVITFLKKTHIHSRNNFFGEKNNKKENWEKYSIEKRVSNETLPTFIWTIKNDKIVPYENSVFMIKSLEEKKVKFESKIFEKGIHGMALADELSIRFKNPNYKNEKVAKWPDLAINFFKNLNLLE